MKILPLTEPMFSVLDDADYSYFSQWGWQFVSGYATRFERHNGERKTIYLHREILKPSVGMIVDHINGNTLDNRRCNLREATKRNNSQNSTPKRNNNTTGYKGVTWSKKDRKWVSRITLDGNRIYLGSFRNKEDAARAYNIKAIELFGEFANLNVIEES